MTERWQEIAHNELGVYVIQTATRDDQLAVEAEPACRRIAELEAEVAGLGAWSCESCGCRFGTSQPAALLDGVTQCSKCVEVGVLEAEVARLNARYTDALNLASQYFKAAGGGS